MNKTKILALMTATVLLTGLIAFVTSPEVTAKKSILLEMELFPCRDLSNTINDIDECDDLWVIKKSDVTLDKKGNLSVKVKGLLLDPKGGEPSFVKAGLTCGEGFKGFTPLAPLSSKGDAKMKGKIVGIPSPCVGPVILVISGSDWIAASGF